MKLYSFDVYDTLLTRRVAVPADLFHVLGAALQAGQLVADQPEQFAAKRAAAEVAARQAAPAGEARFSEIYAKLAATYGWTTPQTEQAMALELQVESQNTQAVPGQVAKVQRARAEGFQVLFLSDMYLPGAFILQLLRREGFFQEGDELLVSSELRQAKHNGSVFPLIRARHADLETWQHTGDNPRADVEMPRRHGITAQLETRCGLTAHERFVHGGESAGPLWRSHLTAALKLARLEGWNVPEPQRAVWESGANVVGPLWFGFAEWCLDEALKRGIQRLYFVARDGQIFHKIAREIARHRGLAVECRYLYGSRQAWHLPGLEQLDEAAFQWIFNRQRYLTTEQVLKRVGLEPQDFKSALAGLGISESAWTTDLTAELTARLRDWLQTAPLRAAIQKRVATARDLALRYLEQEGALDGTPYALVDIGWHGNMQRSFANMLRANSAEYSQPMIGLYFGLQWRIAGLEPLEAVSYWPEKGEELLNLRTLNLGLLEMMAAADHGTVMGFQSDGTAIKPVLDGKNNEAALTWGLMALQSAALKFTTIWLDLGALPQEDRAQFQSLSRQLLLNFIAAPTPAEASIWAEFPHSGEQIERHKESIAPKWNWRESCAAITNPTRRPPGWWVEGSHARHPNPALRLLLIARKLKRAAKKLRAGTIRTG